MQATDERVAVRLRRRGDPLFLELRQNETVDVAADPGLRTRGRGIDSPNRLEGPVPRPDYAFGYPAAQCRDRRRVEPVLSHRHPHRRIRGANAAQQLARIRISWNDCRPAPLRRPKGGITVGELQSSGCESRAVAAEAV